MQSHCMYVYVCVCRGEGEMFMYKYEYNTYNNLQRWYVNIIEFYRLHYYNWYIVQHLQYCCPTGVTLLY